jgi:dCTP deaminase
MILFKSAIREAILSGRITIEDDNGRPFPGWEYPETLEVMAPIASTVYDLTAPGIVVPKGGDYKDPVGLQPASIDLHLGNHWLVPKPNAKVQGRVANGSYPDGELSLPTYDFLDTAKPIEYKEYKSEAYMIPAHGFVLVRTQEVVGLDQSLFGKVDGRSSFGRAGLFAETAGIIDNGFKGSITLEVVNALPYPVKLYAGTRCCQITFYEGKGSAEGGYQGTYQGQLGTKGSMLYKTVPGGDR